MKQADEQREATSAERILRGIVNHWNEFGPEHGLDEKIDAASRFLAAALPPAAVQAWQPIETAPKDGTPVLFKPRFGSGLRHPFVGRFHTGSEDWGFAAPVGFGGIDDGSLEGWMPLPAVDEGTLTAGKQGGDGVTACPNAAHMGEHACANKAQCWEPCGELGNDEKHVRVASAKDTAAINKALGVALGEGGKNG